MSKCLEDVKNLTFEITNRCNLKCRMCSIWKEREINDLDLVNILSFVSKFENRLSISLTGGECFLHPEFEKIYRYLYFLYIKKRVISINITTNGYATEKILEFLKNSKAILHGTEFGISLDGLKETHNLQRGMNNAFQKTVKTIRMIKRRYPFIPISIKTVITKLNYKDLYSIYELAKKLGCFFEPKFGEYLSRYYHRIKETKIIQLSRRELKHTKIDLLKILKDKYKGKNNLWIVQLVKFTENPDLNFIKKCLTPKTSLFIDSRGNIFPCLYQDPVGNIHTGIVEEGKRKAVIEKALKGKCPKCLSYHGFLKGCNRDII